MIVEKINQYLSTSGKAIDEAILSEVAELAKWSFERQFGIKEEREVTKPYFSSIGKCLRQQAYKILGFIEHGKEIDSRARMIFFQGDMVELAIVEVAKVAGCNITACGKDQETIEWENMRGRPDGILDGKYLVEVKSFPSYRYDAFQQGDLPEDYRYQCNAGMAALNLDSTVIVGYNKDAGVLGEMIIRKDPKIIEDIKERVNTLAKATKLDLPYRPYQPDEKNFLPWQCLYCAHWETCWPDAQKIPVKGKYKLIINPKKEIINA